MGTAERRHEILKLLCRRRYETINNLALEFGVSERTIRRDIEALSVTEPIYTQSGRYVGGVYVVDGFYMDRMYMSDKEINVLKKIYILSECNTEILTQPERKILDTIITKYLKPPNKL